MPTACDIKIWRSLELGFPPMTAKDFHSQLKTQRMEISDYGFGCMKNPSFMVNGTREEVDLLNMSVGELGLVNGGTGAEIFDAAKALGAVTCPNEVGPRLRQSYKDQPVNELLLIGMEPLVFTSDRQMLFGVANIQGIPALGGYIYKPERFYLPSSRFIWVKPRQ